MKHCHMPVMRRQGKSAWVKTGPEGHANHAGLAEHTGHKNMQVFKNIQILLVMYVTLVITVR